MKSLLEKILKKIKTHIEFSSIFPPQISDIYEIMWKSMVEPDRIQMTKYGACALHTVKAIDTLSICNNSASTETIVTRTRINITLHEHCLLFISTLRYRIGTKSRKDSFRKVPRDDVTCFFFRLYS